MIEELLKEKNISLYRLSKLSGVPYSTLADIVSGHTSMDSVSAGNLAKISRALNVSMDSLYYGRSERKTVWLYNEGRDIHIEYEDLHFRFMGPKNLIALKNVNRIADGCAHINVYYSDDNVIYTEEEYFDIKAEFEEYGCGDRFPEQMELRLGKPGEPEHDRYRDEALMISDNIAFLRHESSTDDAEIEIVNMARRNARMILRLKDYAILSSSMSETMQRRTMAIVRRNVDLLSELVTDEGSSYA